MSDHHDAGGGLSAATSTVTRLEADGLQKSFAGRTVLHPFRLTIGSGEIHALLGQNGSGKSTLIKVLSGLHEPDFPAVCLVGGRQLTFGVPSSSHDLGLRFVHQELGLIATETVVDNLSYLSGYETRFGTIRSRDALGRAEKMLATVGIEIDPRTPVSELSAVQRTGVAVARAIGMDFEATQVLVLDEPTATLPEEEVEHLHAMLRNAAAGGVGILYVTHHLEEVYRLASTLSVLRDGELVLSGAVAQTERSAVVHALVGSELEAVHRETVAVATGATARVVVRSIEGGSLRGASFEAYPGEIVGISGVDGSGRESVLGAVYGSVPRTGGAVTISGVELPAHTPRRTKAMRVGYLPPDRKVAGAFLPLTAAENITVADLNTVYRRGWLRLRSEKEQALSWFQRLHVRPSDGLDREFATFSGGNQQKIIFAKWLRTDPLVLLLDEPTQGVDVGAKAEIHRQIIAACNAGMAVVVSSTDLEELATLCDRILLMASGRVVDEMTGGGFTAQEITRRSNQISVS